MAARPPYTICPMLPLLENEPSMKFCADYILGIWCRNMFLCRDYSLVRVRALSPRGDNGVPSVQGKRCETNGVKDSSVNELLD